MLNSLDVLQAVYKARYFNTEIKKDVSCGHNAIFKEHKMEISN